MGMAHRKQQKITTRSQPVARIADHTASHHIWYPICHFLLYVKRIGSMLKTALLTLVKQQLNNTVYYSDGHENTKCQDRIQAKTEALYQKLETER